MKKLLFILFLFPVLLHAQEEVDRFSLRHQLQRCLDGGGNPIPGCMVVTDHLGKQVYFMPADTLYVDGTDLCYITVRGDTVCVEISGAGNTDTRLIPYEDGDSLCFYLYNAVTDDTLSHVCFFIDGGGGTDTHFFGDDLTSDGDHTHNQDGNDITINDAASFIIDNSPGLLNNFIRLNSTGTFIYKEVGNVNGTLSLTETSFDGNIVNLDDDLQATWTANISGSWPEILFITQDFATGRQADFKLNTIIGHEWNATNGAGKFSAFRLFTNSEVQFSSTDSAYRFIEKPPLQRLDTLLTMDEDGYLRRTPIDSLNIGSGACDSLEFFTNDDEAIGVGVNPGQYYLLDDDNTYGMAWGVVKVVSEPGDLSLVAPPGCIENSPDEPFSFYEDDDEADTVGGLDVGEFYLLSDDNLYGMPTGTMKQRTL